MDKIYQSAVYKRTPARDRTISQACCKSDYYQCDMPEERVLGQRGVRVIHSAGVEEGKYPAEQPVVH